MNKFVVVDIESTGNSPKKGDRMIQFAAVTIEEGRITNTYTTYINPEIPVPAFITELTGISDTDLVNAPIFYEVAEEIFQLLDGHYFVAHNAHFDLNFLQEELNLNGYPSLNCRVIDTVEMTRILMPTLESYRLADIADYAGYDHDRPHQADSDAFVTAEWFLTLLKKVEALPFATLKQLERLAFGLKSNLNDIFQNVAVKKVREKEKLPEQWVEHHGIVLRRREDSSPITKTRKDQLLHVTGDILDVLPEELKQRQGMTEMIQLVYKSLEQKEIAVIETEPKLNKTFAYLIPAVLFSFRKKKPVVISTHSIRQQSHIIEHVIPQVEKLLQQSVKTQILKGKNQYLDLQKFVIMLNQEDEHYDETITKMQILVWLLETTSGDVSELNLSSGGELFWKRINVAATARTVKDSIWTEFDFYHRAVANAQNADIIVTNHHFLMLHLTKASGVFPDMNYLIIDEAHHFEADAAKYFGRWTGYRHIKFLLSRLGNREQMRLLSLIFQTIETYGNNSSYSIDQVENRITNFSEKIDEFYHHCFSMMHSAGKLSMKIDFSAQKTLRYSWERVYDAFTQMYTALEQCYYLLEKIYINLKEKERILLDDFSLVLLELHDLNLLHNDFIHGGDERIIWAESDGHSPTSVTIISQPVHVSDYLAKNVYSRMDSMIFTSNSLTVKNSFTFVLEELGLGEFPVNLKQFTAHRQALKTNLFTIDDLPDIKQMDETKFIQQIAWQIVSLATALKGRILVLFTSQDMIKRTFQEVKNYEEIDDYILLAQGVSSGSPRRLLKQFDRMDKVILFGSNTFWEGIEKQDQDLDALVIVRLPFMAPDHPVHVGKTERLKNEGKNPFYAYSIPVAVLRFKQGFNHLLANKNKEGYFIIFDNRIYTKNYGHYFVDSIASPEIQKISFGELYRLIRKKTND